MTAVVKNLESELDRGSVTAVEGSMEIPILPVRGIVVYPEQIIPLVIGREKSLRLAEEAAEGESMIGIIAQRDPDANEPLPEDLYRYGTGATILKKFKMPDGSQRIIVHGLSRICARDYTQREPYFRALVDTVKDMACQGVKCNAYVVNLQGLFQRAVELAPYLSNEIGFLVQNVNDPGRVADLIAASLNVTTAEKQEVLETTDVEERLRKVTYLMNRELQVLELGSKIQSEVQGEINKSHREYYLREQLKAIQKELGEIDEKASEVEEFSERIRKAQMPEEVQRVAERELNRLSKIQQFSPEYTVARTYLEWLVDLPWSHSTQDNLELQAAEQVLDNDHYDLERVKKRVLEYLAVRKLKADMRGPILCFVGPPGVGKTSLGMSIARALGRKFVRISLGGIRDEAEIRGHRRTYIGALPGRIIQGIRRSGTNNPVFMLDEIDKVGMDFRGDPSSALLEVLDPEQNHSFSDHYLEVPWDLSKVLFIATANLLDPVPPALKDRMEVIELPGYTEEDKLWIAKKFLIPRQIQEHGLTEAQIEFTDDAIQRLVRSYTREAGVRNLEREIASVCRGVAKDLVAGKDQRVVVTEDSLEAFLGPIKFFFEAAERTAVPGVATGMAWTATGGDIIFVEATKMKGKGQLNLTGQLGDVMKESAQAALSYLKSKAHDFGVDDEIFDRIDIHVHVPAGAVPKDGPSAGITIFTALLSLMTRKNLRGDVAMTGEVTLRGLVLPVGGIKEKVLAAKRAGITAIILPEKNRKDLVEIPEHIKKDLKLHFIQRVDEVVGLALAA